jgi:hypothetical protein
MAENWTLAEKREYAWQYFKIHAEQRMSLFNFFVVISALLTAALSATWKKDCEYPIFGFFLSGVMMVISFVFWKLNQRVAYFIKHAEAALMDIENVSLKSEDLTRLFGLEREKTKKVKEKASWKLWSCHMTYAECFGVVYVVFAVIGLMGMVIAILR